MDEDGDLVNLISKTKGQSSIDEQMFTVLRSDCPATFRVQVLQAPGAPPVVVVTQSSDEGLSLTNGAERYASEVWQRLLAAEPSAPVWVQHEVAADSPSRWHLVTFSTAEGYELSGPEWRALTQREIDCLHNAGIAIDRGDEYSPPAPRPPYQPRYRISPAILLPRPRPFREDDCMAAGCSTSIRLHRQLSPRRLGRDCCWYHSGDWHIPCRCAVRLLLRARRLGVAPDAIASQIIETANGWGLRAWDLDALESLVTPPIGIIVKGGKYINGQHRSQAILEAGVRLVVLID